MVDSRSFYDCLSKLVYIYAQVEDKRSAIDLEILKDDLYKTGGHLRWVDCSNMVADSLIKKISSEFLKLIYNQGFWSLAKSGYQKLASQYNLFMVTIYQP